MPIARTSPRFRLKKFFADSAVFQWQNVSLRADLIFTLPGAICLGVGVGSGIRRQGSWRPAAQGRYRRWWRRALAAQRTLLDPRLPAD